MKEYLVFKHGTWEELDTGPNSPHRQYMGQGQNLATIVLTCKEMAISQSNGGQYPAAWYVFRATNLEQPVWFDVI